MDTGTGGQSKSCEETRLMRKVKFWEGLETGGRYFLQTLGDDDGDLHDLHDVNVGVDEEGQVVWEDRNRELNCSLQTLRQGRLSLSKWFYGNNPDSNTASKCNEFNTTELCRYQCTPQLVNDMYPHKCVFTYIRHWKCAMWSIVESFHENRVFELCINLCMRSRRRT